MFKKVFSRRTQSGQAIVLIAIFVIVALIFGAYAVNGSLLYVDRRQAQKASDMAALAGMDVYTRNQGGGDYGAAVRDSARKNGFDDSKEDVTVTYEMSDSWDPVHLPGAKRLHVCIESVQQNPFPFGEKTSPYSACADSAALPIRIDPTKTQGMVAGISKTCNNAESDSSGLLNIATALSNTGLDGNSANGTFGETIHLGDLHLSQQVTTGKDTQLTQQFYVYGLLTFGEYAEKAQTSGVSVTIYYGNKTWNFHQSGTVTPSGIVIVIDGDASFIGYPNEDMVFSLFATGAINAAASHHNWTAAWGGMLAFSDQATNCGSNAIKISADTSILRGNIIALKGGCSLSGSYIEVYGSMVCDTAKASGSEIWFVGDPGTKPLELWSYFLAQ